MQLADIITHTCLIGRRLNNNSLNSDSISKDSASEALLTMFDAVTEFGKYALAGSNRINFSISCLPISM